MNIQLNGKPKEIPETTTVASLLDLMNIRSEVVAVEVNLDVIPRERRGEKALKEGDEVEVVRFVGGGLWTR